MERRIIVNADDLGLCRSVNEAIFQVYRAGNLSSATLMVAMPGTGDALERIQDHPGLGIGLHFCLTEGEALSGRSSLTNDKGFFMDRSRLVRAMYLRRIDSNDITKEFEAQLERMVQMGVRPTHMDSHQHVHMVPGIFSALLPVLKRYELPVRCVDPPKDAIAASMKRPRKLMKQWVNQRFSQQIRARFNGLTNDTLISVHDLDHPGPYDVATYLRMLEATRVDSIVEVMVHPYIAGEDLTRMYAGNMIAKKPFLDRCFAEYEALHNDPVFEGMELIHYGQL